MRKSIKGRTSLARLTLAVTACVCMAATQVPLMGTAALADTGGEEDPPGFSESDYNALGLALTDDTSAAGAEPYSTTAPTMMLTHSEVLVTANGIHGNAAQSRSSLNKLEGIGDHDTKLSNDYGETYGGGGYWNCINSFSNSTLRDEGKYGGGYQSYLSSNSNQSKSATSSYHFSGSYSTSVEFSPGASAGYKKSSVAELRAYGQSSTQTVDGKSCAGTILIRLHDSCGDGTFTDGSNLWPTVNSSQISSSNRFYYLNVGYKQVLDAYFEIEAGDVDGDGIDEIFAYTGAYKDESGIRKAIVNMFKKGGDGKWKTYEVTIDAGSTSSYVTNSRNGSYTDFAMQASPVITIACGDIDRNNREDVAITASVPYANTNVQAGRCEIYTWDDSASKLAKVSGIPKGGNGTISLAGPDGKGIIAANCAFGTFKAYDAYDNPTGKTVEGLIIAGYESTGSTYQYSKNNTITKGAYRFLYFDVNTGQYVLSDYANFGLGKDASMIVESAWSKSDQDGRHTCTLSPAALETANLEGLTNTGAENDAVLFGGDIYRSFMCTNSNSTYKGLGACSDHMSICSEHYNRSNKLDQKNVDQVWISNVTSGAVSDSQYYNESFLASIGMHRDEDLGKDDDYYWMDLSHYTLIPNDRAKTGQEEVIVESNRNNSNYGTWISLALPDYVADSVKMTYNSQYKVYTDPRVLAILQDAPYFKEVDDSYDYLVLGGTGYSTTSGESTSSGWAIEGELGLGIEVEAGFLGGGSAEAEVLGKASYDYDEDTSISYKVTYESHAGEGDKAIVYTLPMLYYIYDVYDEANGKSGTVSLPVSLGPETSVVSMETLDEVFKENGLTEPSAYLKNESGDPASYAQYTQTDGPDGPAQSDSFGLGLNGITRAHTADGWTSVTNAAGATIEQEIESESSTSKSFEVGGTVNYSVKGGFKLFGQKTFAGIVGNFSAGYTHMTCSSTGVSFSGAVDNVPEAAEGYGFQWRLGVNKLDIEDLSASKDSLSSGNTDKFWIVGYDVKNVTESEAPAVTGFAPSSANSSSITLKWDDVLPAGSEYKYGVAMMGSSSTEAGTVVSDWKFADAGTTQLTWDGLSANTVYRFAVAAVDKNGKQAGIRSEVIDASTMPSGVNFAVQGVSIIGTSPLSSTSSCYIAEGSGLTLYASADITDANGNPVNPKFTWYMREPGKDWKSVGRSDASSPSELASYTIDSITQEMDDVQYYCMASYSNMTMSTAPIRIYVKEPKTTSVTRSFNKVKNSKKQLPGMVSEPSASFTEYAGAKPMASVYEDDGSDHNPEKPNVAPKKGSKIKVGSMTYVVTGKNTVKFASASKKAKTVTIGATIKYRGVTYKVTGIASKAFKGTKTTKVVVKSKHFSKSGVKNSLKSSKVTTVKVKVSSKKATNKKYAKKYAKYFTKKNCGKKVKVKA